MRSFIATGLVVLVASLGGGVGDAWAGFGEGITALMRNDHAAALRELRPLAEQGDPDAQYWLGTLYELGHGVPQSPAEAMRWYRKAAAQGNAAAQHVLGSYYWLGGVLRRDSVKAEEWLRKSAEQGYALAQFALGYLLSSNRPGVHNDDVEAVKWFRRAAEHGETAAHLALGNMYENGRGVPRDYVRAYLWYDVAASQLRGPGERRDNVAMRMTPAQIAEAQKLAREWWAKFEARKKRDGK